MRCKHALLFALCLLLAVSGAACAAADTNIAVLRIGQADAIILMTDGHAVLIDAGEDEDAGEILAFLKLYRVTTLDAMIITHFDKDHVGGADGVLEGIAVEAVYDADYEADSKQYRQYEEALQAAGAPRHRVNAEVALTFGEVTLTLMPSGLDVDSDNDRSVVISAADAHHTFFFAADAEEARIDELLEAGLAHHDLVKMPHHGRDKENLDAFLDALTPGVAVITDSEKNPAEAGTLQKLGAHGVAVYRTLDGDILITSGDAGLRVLQ